MQKHAHPISQKQYTTVFEPLPVEADTVLYFDRAPVSLPYAEDFPKMHYHNRYEIGICESGEGLFLSEQGYHSISAGDLILVPPKARHYSRSLHENAICQCRFAYLQADAVEKILKSVASESDEFRLAKLAWHIPTVLRPMDFPKPARLLSEILELCNETVPNRAPSAILRFATLLLEANRLFPHLKEEADTSSGTVGRTVSGAEEIAAYLSLHYRESHTADQLARICHLSASQLRRQFLAAYEMPPIAYRNTLRCKIAAALLRSGNLSIAEISDQVGYASPSDFYRAFRLLKGVSPSEYRKQNSISKK